MGLGLGVGGGGERGERVDNMGSGPYQDLWGSLNRCLKSGLCQRSSVACSRV